MQAAQGSCALLATRARAAHTDEVKDLRREARDLKEVVAEQTLELRLLKKLSIYSVFLESYKVNQSLPPPHRLGNCISSR